MSGGLTGDDYAAMAESYEQEPPRRDEMVGEPVLHPRTDCEPDAVTGELNGPAAAAGDPAVSRAESRRVRRCL